jgi:putative Holliday junction resolvase
VDRVLAVDPGTVRVGLALSDEGRSLATPLTTLAAGPGLAAEVAETARREGAGLIVVGLPRRLDGGEGPEAVAARALAAEIGAASGLAVEMWDERLTSRMAERALGAGLHPRRGPAARRGGAPGRPAAAAVRARKANVDRVAAAILLQSFLDRRR